jgi:hypothetical protein
MRHFRYSSGILPVIFRIAGFAGFAGLLLAQTKLTNVQIIPTPADVTGTLSWLELRANGIHKFTWKAPDALAADVVIKWPTDGAAGFLYSDGAGNTNWTGAGTCGVDCMTLTTNQTAAGIKTFQNGLILQGTSTSQNFNVLPTYTLDVGTPGALNIQLGGGSASWNNGAGVQRVLISQAGGASTVSGIVRTFNATDTINSMDSLGIFSAVGFNVGTYASPIPIVDAAGLVTPVSFQLAAGATNGFCLVSDAAGVGTWQACSAGGSFVTTNTNQTGLTGTKTWDSAHTHNASILTGTNNTNNIGDPAAAFANVYSQRIQPEFIEIYNTARSAYWRQYVPTSNSFALDSGSGAQQELQVDAVGPTDTRWFFRGTLAPLVSPSGSNGDIGTAGNRWRSGFFSSTVNANLIELTGLAAGIRIGGTSPLLPARVNLFTTSFAGYDLTLTNAKWFISWGNSSQGALIRTFSDGGAFENGFDSTNGVLTNVGYSVGEPFGSPVRVIDNAGNATFPTLTLPVGAVNGYIWTSDAAGVGSWQVNAATGSYVTTNTNQVLIAGTKEWSNLQTYNGGVAVKLGSTARYWGPEADAAYDLGSSSMRWREVWATSFATRVGSFDVYNLAGTTIRTTMTQAGVTTYDALGTAVNTMLIGGFNTTAEYRVNGTMVIDTFRNVAANTMTASNGTFTGNLTVLGTCTGCSSGWTTNTTQTGLSGDKTTSGNLTLTGSGLRSLAILAPTSDITVRNGTGAIRAYFGSASGLISVRTGPAGSETDVIQLSPSGVELNNLAQTGQTTSVVIGACTMNFTYGWLTSKSGC